MTDSDNIIASMVHERREVKRRIACLEERLDRIQAGLGNALGAVKAASDGTKVSTGSYTSFPEAQGVYERINELQNARERLATLDKRLDAC